MYLESFKKFSTHETSLEITINDEENLNLYKKEFDIVLTKEDANFQTVKEIIC